MHSYKKVFYTTIGDFENCGSFLDFLKESTEVVAFLELKAIMRGDEGRTTLFVFNKGKITDQRSLYTVPKTLPRSLHALQHIVFFLNILQSLWIVRKNKPDLAITTFSVAAAATVLAKFFGLCRKTLLWHWDYMPLPDKLESFLLRFVDPLDTWMISVCDVVWYASKNQFELRLAHGHIKDPQSDKHHIVHWGNTPLLSGPKSRVSKALNILYIGSILPEKGVLELVQSLPELLSTGTNGVRLILAGPFNHPAYNEQIIKYINENSLEDYVEIFPGFIKGKQRDEMLEKGDICVALYPKYVNGVKNYAYYSDPAKLRTYISHGLPILLTDVPEISAELEYHQAGIIVKELTPIAIASALKEFTQNPEKYYQGAYKYSKVDEYKHYYTKLLNES